MSDYQRQDNTATLWPNVKWTDEGKMPKYTGEGLRDGAPVKVAVWERTMKNGRTYLWLKFETPQTDPNKAPF